MRPPTGRDRLLAGNEPVQRHCWINPPTWGISIPTSPGPKPFYAPYFWVNDAVQDKADFTFGHPTPTLKIEDSRTPDLPFQNRNFVPAGKSNRPGWGASFKIDFAKIKEKTITLGRFNPAGHEVAADQSEVVGMRKVFLGAMLHRTLIRTSEIWTGSICERQPSGTTT